MVQKKPPHTSKARKLLFASVLLACSGSALAVPFNANVSITGSVSYDNANSQMPTGNTTQAGSLNKIVGGATTTSTLSGASMSPSNAQSGSLTDIGDGFGIKFSGSGSGANGISTFGNHYADFAMSLTNNSAVDTYLVKLKIDFSNSVSATTGPNVDAFAYSDIRLQDTTNNQEVFYSGPLLADGKYGNSREGVLTGAYGGTMTDSDIRYLLITLAPTSTINLGDSNAEITVRGGAYDLNSSFSLDLRTLITVESVLRQGGGTDPTVPAPAVLSLLSAGLIGIAAMRRRRT